MNRLNHCALRARNLCIGGSALSVMTAMLLVHAPPLHATTVNITPTQVINNWTQVHTPIQNIKPNRTLPNLIKLFQASPSSTQEIYVYQDAAFVSNFNVAGDFRFQADFRVMTNNDDDAIGFFWGWQDAMNHYRFTWDRWDGRTAEPMGDLVGINGISNHPNSPDIHGPRIIKEVNGSNYYFYQEVINPIDQTAGVRPTPWQWSGAYAPENSTMYHLDVNRMGNTFLVEVTRYGQSAPILRHVFNDPNAHGGKIGFFSDHQAAFMVSNMQFSLEPVPEPSTIALAAMAALGLGGMVWMRRRQLRRKAAA